MPFVFFHPSRVWYFVLVAAGFFLGGGRLICIVAEALATHERQAAPRVNYRDNVRPSNEAGTAEFDY